MKKIIECVPNFSEGRNKETIEAIAQAIRETEGVTLLDVDPGFSTNRTVYTFVGDPKSVVEGALSAARVAHRLIDMTKHEGEHPRMGAMDVCPFVPVANVTMDECVECAKEFGLRVADELNIPIYLYENAAENEFRKTLPQIRKGEYEGIEKKIIQPEWKPDFGPAKFVPKWGATATGARFFLVAYNINVLGTSNQAHRIALNIREAGRSDNEPGRLKECKAMGWYVEEYGMAQITMNLTNYKVTPVHIAFEECLKDAKELKVGIAGSELVGLIPLEAMLMAAEYYIEKENLFILDEKQKIKLVVERLGLNSVSKFDPDKRIIEYMIEDKKNEPLASMTVRNFIEEIAARTSAPGGGSASAAIAAIGTGLGCMVAQLTYGVRKFEHLDDDMRRIIPHLNDATQYLIPMIDADTNAFNDYMDALRLPKSNDEEKAIRTQAMQAGLKKAIEVPLKTMRLGNQAWDWMIEIAKYGNIASRSDVEVGARALEVGIWGALKNVEINLPGIKDEQFKNTILAESGEIMKNAEIKCKEVLDILNNREK
ncbi:MAG: glutamate formimidoyltransferase [Candidatus Kapabacteria bacterium]|nr:glutamate formimidoyltransferase [Ignavibacteriota bacterium]MCW5885111.1 glutamate formimidoyltransferase [Candidatus Kapabacteria bacterium]